jgi:hypothetical protein
MHLFVARAAASAPALGRWETTGRGRRRVGADRFWHVGGWAAVGSTAPVDWMSSALADCYGGDSTQESLQPVGGGPTAASSTVPDYQVIVEPGQAQQPG